jgi:thymidylate synthase ThyX
MISAKIIADSISESEYGDRITTFELEYPRFIHGELMTHRLFSRNAASSRAIPINKMMDQVLTAPAMPVEWGLNKSGMQAEEMLKGQL